MQTVRARNALPTPTPLYVFPGIVLQWAVEMEWLIGAKPSPVPIELPALINSHSSHPMTSSSNAASWELSPANLHHPRALPSATQCHCLALIDISAVITDLKFSRHAWDLRRMLTESSGIIVFEGCNSFFLSESQIESQIEECDIFVFLKMHASLQVRWWLNSYVC